MTYIDLLVLSVGLENGGGKSVEGNKVSDFLLFVVLYNVGVHHTVSWE